MGRPSATSSYGRITNGTLVLGGTVDPVLENGVTPPTGAEYFVRTGPSTGTFATVLDGATADYSHADEVGLVGGAPATATVTGVTSSIPAGLLLGEPVQLTAVVTPAVGHGAHRVGLVLRRRHPARLRGRGDQRNRLDQCHAWRVEPACRGRLHHGDLQR